MNEKENTQNTMLNADLCGLYELRPLPANLLEIYCCFNKLSCLPTLPKTLRVLKCASNRLTRLPELPDSLRILHCGSNELSHLPKLPDLIDFEIHVNDFKSLRGLPSSLVYLSCGYNELTELELSANLKVVNCSNNQIQTLVVPHGLKELNCHRNKLVSLALPDTLRDVDCSANQIELLHLSSGLKQLICHHNQLESLTLPDSLEELNCAYNKITELKLNERLASVLLSHNPLVSAPVFPKHLRYVDLRFTNVEACFEITDRILKSGKLFIQGTPLYTKIKAVTDEPVTNARVVKMAFDCIVYIEKTLKHMYYSIKAKSRMLAWMWRARESLAMKKYHPDELFKRLDDLDALERW